MSKIEQKQMDEDTSFDQYHKLILGSLSICERRWQRRIDNGCEA